MWVLNLPKILREYMVLWAIWTMFGVTQDVDMVVTQDVDMLMTRTNKFGRFAAAVMEPELIPTKMDVIIGNLFFELLFEVESFDPNLGVRSLWDVDDTKGHDTKTDGSEGIPMK